MRPDLIADLYEKEENYWWHVCKRELVLSILENVGFETSPAGTRVGVDIGCGTGYTAKVLDSHWRTVGVDISADSLRFCQRRGLKRVSLVDMTRLSLPFKADSFDFILALDVIEHLEDDFHALRECQRVLKAGGVLIITVPAFMALWSPWDEALGHKRRYTANSFLAVVEKTGLATRRISYMFLFVFPAAVIIRQLKRWVRSEAASYPTDFIPIPKFLNRALVQIGRLERWLITSLELKLPFGLSVLAVMQKPST